MYPVSLPINICDAKPSDLGALGKLHASAVVNDNLWKTLWDKVDPVIRNEYLWNGVVADGVAMETDDVRSLEKTDTSEPIGVIWFSIAIKYKDDKQEVQRPRPDGFNHESLQKFMIPTRNFQQEMLERYGGYLCKSSAPLLWRKDGPADRLGL